MASHLSGTMTAYRFNPDQGKLVAERVAVPIPNSDQVLVKILAAGVCRTDLGVLDPTGDFQPLLNPDAKSFTLGHECSGVIVALGTAVTDSHPELNVGTYVAIYSADACFKADCYNCSHNMPNLCTSRGYGVNLDGAWAAYAAIRAECVLPVPATQEAISPSVISATTDAAITPYHAMKTCCRIQPEHTVLCIGVGGLGNNAVAIAKKVLKARCVIACDVRQVALVNAKEAGADYITTPDALPQLITTHQLFVDFAFDFVGSQSTFDLCFSSIRCGGTVHLVGIHSKSLNIIPLMALSKELTFKVSFYGTKQDLVEVLQAVVDGVFRPQIENRPMSEVFQVLDDLRDGKLASRIALIPSDD